MWTNILVKDNQAGGWVNQEQIRYSQKIKENTFLGVETSILLVNKFIYGK